MYIPQNSYGEPLVLSEDALLIFFCVCTVDIKLNYINTTLAQHVIYHTNHVNLFYIAFKNKIKKKECKILRKIVKREKKMMKLTKN